MQHHHHHLHLITSPKIKFNLLITSPKIKFKIYLYHTCSSSVSASATQGLSSSFSIEESNDGSRILQPRVSTNYGVAMLFLFNS
uniref:Uncharacterized protein n=1 Tax=Oryza sativa subsp. japonica TaxID=39947 RepID=Q8H3G0_ORYSJ|nr:hypothetical protein [Oryza sativa Japonica Group]